MPRHDANSFSDSQSSGRDSGDVMHDNGGQFPLPDGYFPELRLTATEIKNYEAQMQEIVKNALAEYELHEAKGVYPVYRASWSVVGKVEGLTTIKKETPDNPTTSQARIFGRINGDYRHFIDFFYAETSAELFAWNQFMFGYATDAAVLKNIHTVASKKKCLYMGIKWTCLNPSSLVKKRDNCYMEYLVYTKDLRGRDVGVRVTLPLDIPECPELPKKLKTKRIRLNTVWISRPADREPNVTEFFMLSQNNFNGLAVTANYYKRMMNILMNMAVFVDSRRILMQGVVAKKSWAKSGSRKSCSVCSRKFGPTRRRHHCRLCGDLICRRCAIVRDAPKEDDGDGAGSNRTFEIVKTKFCVLCVTKMRASRSNVLVPVPAPSGKLSVVDCVDVDLDEFRQSTISETESEGGHISFFSDRGGSEGRSLQLSPQSTSTSSMSSSLGKVSFVSKLDVIDDEAVTILAVPRMTTNELIEEEVAEVIDTTDMVPVSLLGSSAKYNATHASSPSKDADYGKTSSGSGTGWSPLGSKTSPRSLDQCLAEQEELLRRMMLSASGGMQHQNSSNPGSGSLGSSGCNPGGVQSTRSRPEVTLYEG
ncbi:1-phosphatidylinositol 3-phosphate 5-kinase FAB1 [Phytophthora cinnamomi]|uniref:1-phosphatidylinositol 3-phosphate 5-kinase FAB1 n=1 Tax=Phytophthora cinnamomi TaxID=4785 RepID=UPI00355A8178|nr:1-phosphatidylinositol 3-phosphate 5-kinase FAB1 [Phytophthora cinnamomi]